MYPSTAAVVLGILCGMIGIHSAWGFWKVRRFLVRTPVLRTAEDLAKLKRYVATDMISALVLIALAILAGIVAATSLACHLMHPLELVIVLAASAGYMIPFAVWVNLEEKRVRELPAISPELLAERDRLVKTWRWKVLPDWWFRRDDASRA